MTEATGPKQQKEHAPKIQRASEVSAYRETLGLLAHYPALFSGFLIVCLLASLSEGLGAGAAISLLQSPQGAISALKSVPLLGSLASLFSDMAFLDRVRIAALALVAIVLVRGLFLYVSQLLSVRLQVRVDRDLRQRVFRQLLAVELSFIHGDRIGNLFTILNEYPRQVSRLIQFVADGIVNLSTIVVYATLMLFISWPLTLLAALLLLGVTALLRRWFRAQIKQASRDINAATVQLNAIGFESLSAIKLIHLFSKEARGLARFEDALNTYQGHVIRRGNLVSAMRPLFTATNVIVLGILLTAGTFLLPSEAGTWVGLMAVFLVIVFRLMTPAAALNDMRVQVLSLYPAMQVVLYFLHREDKPYLKNGTIRFDRLKEGIVLDGVTFRYASDEPLALLNATFAVPKGKMTAVVGPSGAGKTTLGHLIARLYDPQVGCITVDGTDLRDLDIPSWHARLAVVSQDTFIFNDTVAANLRFAKEDATDEEIHQAARLANAHDFILTLPQGYDTLLGDRGVRLSGGQQQRIAIARAILTEPQVLILDEATSHLDSETERSIQEAIDRLRQDRTVLVVAHRLSTVRHADNIIVLDKARVVEQGSHAELIRQRGHYWRLVQAQSLEENVTGEG